MNDDRKLSMEIVTIDGIVLKKGDVDYIVVRLKERGVEIGSEQAIYPKHAPLLARIDSSLLRYGYEGEVHDLQIGEGVMEVENDLVTIVVFSSSDFNAKQAIN